ncbi:MAG TPA: tRNA pseudouridine(55) synthase TruB [Schlesneria sp.]|jgi:tRNA pseudouridine55 synthase
MVWCGIVTIDKPAGLTSRQIVDKVAKIVRPAKTGHAGTLDPLATGVLVIAVGSATRLISYLQQGRKRYIGEFQLGVRSNTDDVDGQITEGGDWTHITEQMLADAVAKFVGAISQVPPQFSAVHVGGQRAYKLARQGESVEIAARRVEVFSIRVTQIHLPKFVLQIECGSGTYVRSIGRDLGEHFGCGAIMTSLRRLSVGPCRIEDAVSFADLDEVRLRSALQPALTAVAELPQRIVGADEIRALRQGRTIGIGSLLGAGPDTEVALIDAERQLIGVARFEGSPPRLQPHIIFPQ